MYACVPYAGISGVVSPVKEPQKVDMRIFRENTEDIYAGIEWEAGTPEAEKFYRFLHDEMGVTKVRFPETSSFGVKPVSKRRNGAPGACGLPICARASSAFRDAGTQRKYHEVYRRRLQEMGVRAGGT